MAREKNNKNERNIYIVEHGKRHRKRMLIIAKSMHQQQQDSVSIKMNFYIKYIGATARLLRRRCRLYWFFSFVFLLLLLSTFCCREKNAVSLTSQREAAKCTHEINKKKITKYVHISRIEAAAATAAATTGT